MRKRGSMRCTWGWLGMCDSCVITSHLLEMPEKIKDLWVINFCILFSQLWPPLPSLPQTQTNATHSPPPTGACVGPVFQWDAEWTFLGTAFSTLQAWLKVSEAGLVQSSGYIKGTNILRHWVVNPLFSFCRFVAAKRTNMYEGKLQSSTLSGKHYHPFEGSAPEGHLYLSDVKAKTCPRRIMENRTSIFWTLTVYHISESRYVPGTELTIDDTVSDVNDIERLSYDSR